MLLLKYVFCDDAERPEDSISTRQIQNMQKDCLWEITENYVRRCWM